MKSEYLKSKVWILALVIIFNSCQQSNSQPTRESLSGTEVLPGSEMMDVTFFTPFKVNGKIQEESGNNSTLFREFEKEMNVQQVNGEERIIQNLTYFSDGKKTGTHITHYNPTTFQVVYWEYKSHSNSTHFAFKAEGTNLLGTQNPTATDPGWQGADLGFGLFQNESRELFFRSLHSSEKGVQVKFPIIGMQAPYHGWVSYQYSEDRTIEYNGERKQAKIWSSSGNPDAYYVVIDVAPYVIKRVVPSGKKSQHVFSYSSI